MLCKILQQFWLYISASNTTFFCLLNIRKISRFPPKAQRRDIDIKLLNSIQNIKRTYLKNEG